MGHTKDGRAYYRGESDPDMYIYYDGRCSDDVPQGAWILGREPSLTADESLDKAPRRGCWNDALIMGEDWDLPVGVQHWDWVWCGNHGRMDKTLMINVEGPVKVERPWLVAPPQLVVV